MGAWKLLIIDAKGVKMWSLGYVYVMYALIVDILMSRSHHSGIFLETTPYAAKPIVENRKLNSDSTADTAGSVV